MKNITIKTLKHNIYLKEGLIAFKNEVFSLKKELIRKTKLVNKIKRLNIFYILINENKKVINNLELIKKIVG